MSIIRMYKQLEKLQVTLRKYCWFGTYKQFSYQFKVISNTVILSKKKIYSRQKRESVYDVKSMGIITYISVEAVRFQSSGMVKIQRNCPTRINIARDAPDCLTSRAARECRRRQWRQRWRRCRGAGGFPLTAADRQADAEHVSHGAITSEIQFYHSVEKVIRFSLFESTKNKASFQGRFYFFFFLFEMLATQGCHRNIVKS